MPAAQSVPTLCLQHSDGPSQSSFDGLSSLYTESLCHPFNVRDGGETSAALRKHCKKTLGEVVAGVANVMATREEEDYPDEMEERLVNEEYKIWKKNTPFLYGEWRLLMCGNRGVDI